MMWRMRFKGDACSEKERWQKVLTYYLLVNCPAISGFTTQWRDRLRTLLLGPPRSPTALSQMGIPTDWQSHPMWM